MKRRIRDRYIVEDVVLRAIRCGFTKKQAAGFAGIHRATLYRWLESDPAFATRFERAWYAGADRRDFRLWLAHPFRGYRPPRGKGTRVTPRYGRRRR